MKADFLKFPSTPHLTTLPGVSIRDDKVLTAQDRENFLQHPLIVEEKVDGANLGISFDSEANIHAQNRGAYLILPASGQWKKLDEWLAPRIDDLFEYLADQYILFGEWCYARHSIFYDRLPDWFLAFDIFDKEAGHFLSTARRDSLLEKMSLNKVPFLGFGHFSLPELEELLSQSQLSDGSAEGIYLRFDEGAWLGQRAKLVRSTFIQAVEEHWSRSAIQPNQLQLGVHR